MTTFADGQITKVISYSDFDNLTFKYVGSLKNTYNELFVCLEDQDFNVLAFFGDEDENGGCSFEKKNVGVLLGDDDTVEEYWRLDDDERLLNIDASHDVLLCKLDSIKENSMQAVTLEQYIADNYKGQTGFADYQGVLKQQVTKWLASEMIVVNDTLYSKRRELN